MHAGKLASPDTVLQQYLLIPYSNSYISAGLGCR